MDGSLPGSPVPEILQARTLEWVAISFSNAWKWKVKVKSLSHVWLLVTPWTAAYQAPPSMGFSRQEYWSGVPLPNRMHCISFKTVWRFSYILKRNANQDRSRQEWRERSMCTRNSALSYATFLNFTLMEWNDLPYTFSWLWKLMST